MVTQLINDFLDIGEVPHSSDCIFVLAGRQDRKVYGLDLWRGGNAPEIILSVGRFEWRRFYDLSLPDDGGLKVLVDQTPAAERHFFVRLNGGQASSSVVRRSRFGTLTEGRALAAQLGGHVRSLLVVSSPIHLRRVALVLRRALHGRGIRLTFVGVPGTRESARALWSELIKYLFYLLRMY